METFQFRPSIERLEDRTVPATVAEISFAAAQAQATAAMIGSIVRDMDWVFNPAMRPTVQQFVRTIYQQSNAAMAMGAAYPVAQSNANFAQNVANGLGFSIIELPPPVPPQPDSGMSGIMPPVNSPSWVTQANGLKTWDVRTGSGDLVVAGDSVTVFYTGWLTNGTSFDSQRSPENPATFTLTNPGVIQGWVQGIPGMQNGGIRRLYIPAALAYGSTGQGNVPPNADLIFEVKMISHT